jgi:large subunit ribosomal protein L14e
VPRASGTATVKKIVAEQELTAKWEKTSWAKTLKQREARAKLNDFDRFKLMIARKQVESYILYDLTSY